MIELTLTWDVRIENTFKLAKTNFIFLVPFHTLKDTMQKQDIKNKEVHTV